ncbi:ATP-binding protein [Clostridium ganghwense]|uniref:ATP-binding protein n=1 Tax=Clostridium ganghwense TaxID=312089 RepID=A0ABT4CSR1_9CLOT|nr:ATP-binding protein [Clostridium ganghwense]MCY6372115.1 ATP-binding protein [Clostridium ganghwense]
MIKGYQSEILKIYEDIRTYEENALKDRKKEIYSMFPIISQLDKKINKLCIQLSISSFKPIENRDEYLKNLKEQITDLRIQKSELLVSHGYEIDCLSLHHRCKKCKDTGFIGTTRCDCYKPKLVKLYYKDSELSQILKTNNFDNFKYDFYSSNRSNDNIKSPRKNIEEIVKTSMYFIETFPNSKDNLLFFGNSGTGKTFLTNCIAKELLDRGHLVVYKTAEELIKNLREIRLAHNRELEDLITNCDLLVIDDLGTEQISNFSKTELFNLLNTKLLKGKQMIVSTNYTIEGLSKTYSERITSRLFGSFSLCKFYGEDIRVKINLNRMKAL